MCISERFLILPCSVGLALCGARAARMLRSFSQWAGQVLAPEVDLPVQGVRFLRGSPAQSAEAFWSQPLEAWHVTPPRGEPVCRVRTEDECHQGGAVSSMVTPHRGQGL